MPEMHLRQLRFIYSVSEPLKNCKNKSKTKQKKKKQEVRDIFIKTY